MLLYIVDVYVISAKLKVLVCHLISAINFPLNCIFESKTYIWKRQ